MLSEAVLLLAILVVIAAYVNGGFAFTIVYLILGIYIISLFWTRLSVKNISCERKLEKRVFLGEEIIVRLEVHNSGWLPIPWLSIYESLPVELAAGRTIKRILSLGPHGHTEVEYKLQAFKRGHYPVGPLVTRLGDTLGLTEIQELEKKADFITVYPRILSLTNPKIPSRSPLGTLRHTQPIFEDPSRVRGKRDYVASDSLRRVDWKASASRGQLQVKQFEPSIALQTVIFLNLNSTEYYERNRIDATELAIVIAATLSNWIISQKQSVGLTTNGVDNFTNNARVKPIPSRKGHLQLLHILDLLARLQGTNEYPFAKLLNREVPNLPWGTTVVLITGSINEELFDEVFQIQRRGQQVVIIIAGRGGNITQARQQATRFGVQVHAFPDEKSLDVWRRK